MFQAKAALQGGMKKGHTKDKSGLSKVQKGIVQETGSRVEKSTSSIDSTRFGFFSFIGVKKYYIFLF